MNGKIIKGIAGFYYVYCDNEKIYECKAKGIFRNKKIKPLVGDNVTIEIISEEKMTGNINEIHERKSELIRPASANIDQAMIIFAVKNPEPNFNLLDRFLVIMDYQNVPTAICFNKSDLISDDQKNKLKNIYEGCGCKVIFSSTLTGEGIQEIKEFLANKTTVLAGPSGVGKSSLTNLIMPKANMQTGDISRIGRGRHTTRHSQIFCINDDSYIMDTPGFTSLSIPEMEKEQLRFYFPEFEEYQDKCRFKGCVHINEPSCAVKDAVEQKKINTIRYENYKLLYNDLKDKKKY